MLLAPKWLLSLRCPVCQERLLYRAISRFELAGGETYTVHCSCGAEPLHLRLSSKHLYTDCFCPCCEESHNYIFRLNGQKAEPPFLLTCETMDVRLASLGSADGVLEAMNEESTLILDYAEELSDYFVRPSIIGRSLLRLNSLLVDRSCLCANCGREDMDVLILSDRLVLSCPHCQVSACLYAARPADLHLMNKITRISLQKDGMRIRYQ